MIDSLGLGKCNICGKYCLETDMILVKHGKYTRLYCDACVANRTVNDVKWRKRNESKQET